MPPTPERRQPVDAGPPPEETVEERLADKLGSDWADGSAPRALALRSLRGLGRYDRSVYRSVAGLTVPLLDEPLRRVSDFANHSKPWFITAGVVALFGGRQGRRAARTGLAAMGVASLVNQPLKKIGEPVRRDRDGLGGPQQRSVTMPTSTSFPSGDSASASAFAVAVGDLMPTLKLPLHGAVSVVASSRVYTGVHYPSDVLVGAALGALLGRATSTVSRHAPTPLAGALRTARSILAHPTVRTAAIAGTASSVTGRVRRLREGRRAKVELSLP